MEEPTDESTEDPDKEEEINVKDFVTKKNIYTLIVYVLLFTLVFVIGYWLGSYYMRLECIGNIPECLIYK